jgi:hypothetical protein
MLECVAVEMLRKGGWEPAGRRLFLTFVTAMDRARDADRLWRVATRMALEQPWTFVPAETRAHAADIGDMLRNYGVSQRHTDDCAAWQQIGESLSSRDKAPTVYDAIYLGRGDARQLRHDIGRVRNRVPLFPFLRRPKIGPMWVRMLAAPGDADIQAIEVLPVAVDVQVRKITEYLGVLQSRDRELDDVRESTPASMASGRAATRYKWSTSHRRYVRGFGSSAVVLREVGCTFCERAGRRLPISDVCAECRLGPS